MEDQKSWQLEQPQGTPLYTVDAHSTQGMYVKRMLLITRRNLWPQPSPCCFCMPILFRFWALYWGFFRFPLSLP